MSLKRLGGETIIYGLANVLPRLINFIVLVPFLTEVMVGEEYGVVGDLFFYIAILIAVLTFRMDTVVFRFASRGEYDAVAVFKRAQSAVSSGVILVAGLGLVFSSHIADALSYPDRGIYVQMFLLTVAFDVLSAVPLARLRLERRAWFFVIVNLGNVLLNVLLVFFFLYFWPKWGEVFGFAFEARFQVVYYMIAIAAAAAFRYVTLLVDGLVTYRNDQPKASDAPADQLGAPPLSTMLAYAAPLVLVAVAGVYNAQSGIPIIKNFFGEDVSGNLYWSGQFSAALKFAVILNLFVTAFNYAAEPFFFRQAGSDLTKADKQIYADATRAFAIVGAVVCAGILVFLPWIKNFLGRDLQEGLYVLPFILAGNFFLGLYSNFAIAYKLTDRTYLGGGIALIGSIICAGIGIGFIDRLGIVAPAAAMTACYFVMCVLAYGVTRRYFPVRYPVGRILIYIGLAAGTTYLARALDAGLLGSIAIFAGLLLCLGAMEFSWVKTTIFGANNRNPAS